MFLPINVYFRGSTFYLKTQFGEVSFFTCGFSKGQRVFALLFFLIQQIVFIHLHHEQIF